MDKTRTLPPLVRGKVTGVLYFFVDEIRLFRNILRLTENFDLVLQIQWWGEILPVYIRPKKLQVQGRICENSHLLEPYYHSTKYEIRTSQDLFKSYLKSCEVAELSILEAVENFVIGSAFLRDLINLLTKNDEPITLPIFDCLGEQIGDVTVHINFLDVPEADKRKINKSSDMYKNHFGGKKSNEYCVPGTVQSNFLREKTIVYDGNLKKNVDHEQHVELEFDNNFKVKKKVISSLSQKDSSFTKQTNVNNNPSVGSSKNFPEVKTLSDSSKILYFHSNSQQNAVKPSNKNPSLKPASKFNSNSIKVKSKPKSTGSISSEQAFNVKLVKKKTEISRNLKSVTADKQIDNIKQQYNTVQDVVEDKQYSTSPTVSMSESLSSKLTDHYNIPYKESNVLDYLLGSTMSKEDEKVALKDLKEMSPSHNLVSSISELCLIRDEDERKPEIKPRLSTPVKQTFLNFDFENPIERSYYEKFFLKSKPPGDFEIAEFLNLPENRFMLGVPDASSIVKNESESGSLKNYGTYSNPVLEDEDCFPSNFSGIEKKKNCSRCRYYKKLDELDTIIESLKHFEKKMLSDEKEIQSTLKENFMTRRNITKDS